MHRKCFAVYYFILAVGNVEVLKPFSTSNEVELFFKLE